MTTEPQDAAASLLSTRGAVVQLAYAVDDVDAAAARWVTCGAGPFFVARHVALQTASHRGEPARFDHSMALGAWNGLVVELFQVHDAWPATLRKLVVKKPGLHHVARFATALDEAATQLEDQGWSIAFDAESVTGSRFTFHWHPEVDHLVELYEPVGPIAAVYRLVMNAAVGWDGDDPVRSL